MSLFGLINEIGVTDNGDGTYTLIYGEARLVEAAELGWKHIDAKVWNVDKRNAWLLHIAENMGRGYVRAIELAPAFLFLRAEFNMTEQEIAHALGVDRSTVSKYLRLVTRHWDLFQKVRAREMGVREALELMEGRTELEEVPFPYLPKDLLPRLVPRRKRRRPQKHKPREKRPKVVAVEVGRGPGEDELGPGWQPVFTCFACLSSTPVESKYEVRLCPDCYHTLWGMREDRRWPVEPRGSDEGEEGGR